MQNLNSRNLLPMILLLLFFFDRQLRCLKAFVFLNRLTTVQQDTKLRTVTEYQHMNLSTWPSKVARKEKQVFKVI